MHFNKAKCLEMLLLFFKVEFSSNINIIKAHVHWKWLYYWKYTLYNYTYYIYKYLIVQIKAKVKNKDEDILETRNTLRDVDNFPGQSTATHHFIKVSFMFPLQSINCYRIEQLTFYDSLKCPIRLARIVTGTLHV